MKPRNFELSPLTEDEFSMMLIGVPDELLRISELDTRGNEQARA